MSGLKVVRYRDEDAPAWNELVDRSRARHFLFRRGYMDYHRERFEDFSLLVHEGERLIAALPAERRGVVVTSHGGLTFGGLLAPASLSARRTLEVFSAIVEMLGGEGVRELVYKPVPHIYHEVPAEEDLYALFRHGAELVRRDLSTTVRPGQRQGSGKRRQAARARRSGVTVTTSEAFPEFMSIEAEVLRARHDTAPTHTSEEMVLLASRFPDDISLVGGFHEDRMVAGVVVYETAAVAHAQYIGASEVGRDLYALDAVLEYLITERYTDKRFFDFGISTTDAGRVLNEGLSRQKESFGGRGTVYDTYRLRLE